MIPDKFLGAYVQEVKLTLQRMKDDLASSNFQDMYQLGRVQGQIVGLQRALELLESLIEETDI